MIYRRLHPVKEGKRTYRFVLTGMAKTKLYGRLANHPDCDFLDAHGRLWAQIRSGWMYAMSDYAWNGCSPKRYYGHPPIGKWVGTPDFKDTITPSLFHDILFQFAEVGKYSFSDANYQFLRMMEENEFPLAILYYEAVEQFGHKFYGHDNEGVKAIYPNENNTDIDGHLTSHILHPDCLA